jgi:hypothetical protein
MASIALSSVTLSSAILPLTYHFHIHHLFFLQAATVRVTPCYILYLVCAFLLRMLIDFLNILTPDFFFLLARFIFGFGADF